MPIYEYLCEKCSHQFELIQKFSDPPVTECPECKGNLRKLISSPGIMFKGSGWYVTDYSNKMKSNNPDKEPSKEKPKEEKASSEKKEPPAAPPPTPAANSDKK